MKRLSGSQLLQVSALTLAVLASVFSGQSDVSAGTAAGRPMVRELTAAAQQDDGLRLIHEATQRYRMFYDYSYAAAAAQRISTTTEEYRRHRGLP